MTGQSVASRVELGSQAGSLDQAERNVIEDMRPGARSIAYLAARLPALSETFVYREVRELRRRGWMVSAASLNPPVPAPGGGAPDPLHDLREALIVLYGRRTLATLGAALLELASRPSRSAATLFTALGDALHPGESLSLPGRIKLVAQAVVALGLARELRSRGVRHIHCHFAHAPATVGMYAAMQLGIPFSFTGHANDLFQRRAVLGRKLERAHFVACISKWHRAFYSEIDARDPDRYVVVRCGVDVDEWLPGVPTRAVGPTFRVLTVCRLVEKKGTDTLIEALHELGERVHGVWELTVAGDGPDRDRLGALAARLGCEGSIRWLGSVDNSRVRELLAQADVLALPCRTDSSGDRDGIPVVLMEAMACGVPVIAGDLPAIRELVDGREAGLLVPGAEPSILAEALARIRADANLRSSLAIAGRAVVEEEFSLAGNVSRLEARFGE